MKNKIFSIAFTAVCLIICAVPFIGMAFAPSDEPIGNEQQTAFPSLKAEDGGFNEDFIQQAGEYFSKHYAFRSQMISADAVIQSKLFGTSNLDSVTVGKDGWLFYSSTLDNYLGRNLMSDRALFNTVNNLETVQEYLAEKGIDFLFTVAPNKNTLYPEYMPDYYSKKESDASNLKSFAALTEKSTLNYCDVLSPLSASQEPLYHKQDSHWNSKGALTAYNTVLDSLGKAHDDYADADAVRTKSFYGDLGKMLYPSAQEPEYNYEYDIQQSYSYVTPTKSVEEAIILTENSDAEGRLYMYRDSFGNALLPFFAEAYGSAYFTKAFPVNLALETQTQQSDTVIFVIAERNLDWFAKTPPVIPARQTAVPEAEVINAEITDLRAEISEVNMQYISITGYAQEKYCRDDSEFAVIVRDGEGGAVAFEAFTVSGDGSDYGFQAYIPSEYVSGETAEISLVIKNGDAYAVTEGIKTEILQVQI